MKKSRILIAVAAAMVALQIVFCFFATITTFEEDDGDTTTIASYSVFDIIKDVTEESDRFSNYDNFDSEAEDANTTCLLTNFLLWLFLAIGFVSLAVGITLNDSDGISYISLLIGTIFMALIPFIMQWSVGEMIRIYDYDIEVAINFTGWIQILCCLPVFFIRASSFEEKKPETRKDVPAYAPVVVPQGTESESKGSFCVYCGSKVVDEAVFCAKCGKKVYRP